MAERRQPLTVEVDLEHGGRWTSLRTPHREWLWQRPSVLAERGAAHPGDAFVDAGGVEECFPTVAGRLDHGDVWSRRWTGTAADARVQASGWDLRRRMDVPDGLLTARYTVTGEPGRGLLHAVHGLYSLSESARVVLPSGTPMRVQDVAANGPWTSTAWPGVTSLERCGPEDGTAWLAVVATDTVQLVDGEDVLVLRWRMERGTGPVSLLLWRNLGGWPTGAPYRSIGVEPLLGAATDVDTAQPGQLARADDSGLSEWSVQVESLKN
ncbi:hypothetical protein [Auraticoccus monumenti]|uniref:Galactose mutarotase n=1 Tax=Auraticoccus monumenti TaxID=675864 RepID=A0A1G6TC71_9ACTN|nr:hypothetical protein [Auraticoccus monumenti]SDD26661.1 hypothetical protein SAMN04489747_0583 [Auraticoccus monumenti]